MRWYQISDVANARQAGVTACLFQCLKEQYLLSSSTHSLSRTGVQLNTPQDQVGDASKDDSQFKAHIHTGRRIDQTSYRARNSPCITRPYIKQYRLADSRNRNQGLTINSKGLSKPEIGAYKTNHNRH